MWAKPPWTSEIYVFQGVFSPQRVQNVRPPLEKFLTTPLNVAIPNYVYNYTIFKRTNVETTECRTKKSYFLICQKKYQ